MARLQIATANRATMRPVAGAGGGSGEPLPPNFAGIIAPENGELVVDAFERSTNTVAGFQVSGNGVYRRDSSGGYASAAGATRTYEDAYCATVRLDALIGYDLSGFIRLRVTRVSDSVVVYEQNVNCAGPDDNSYTNVPFFSGALAVYRIAVTHESGSVTAYDGIVLTR